MNLSVTGPFLAATLLLIPGCGQDLQKQNEALKAEVKTAREENTSLEERLQTLENDKQTLAVNVEALKTQVSDLEKALEAAKMAGRTPSARKRK